MLMNNLHPDVAENPHELVVYGGIGRAARTWEDFDAIVPFAEGRSRPTRRCWCSRASRSPSSHPCGCAARADRQLQPRAGLGQLGPFQRARSKGLMMYGQMTAGSWIYIGTQGIVQGTYETFAEAGRQHYDGDLKGKWILTGGLGGMGGAQPLAAVMAAACCLAVECDETRASTSASAPATSTRSHDLDEALAMIERWTKAGEAKSVGAARQCGRHLPRNSQGAASPQSAPTS
jgi:urocanate hydratase